MGKKEQVYDEEIHPLVNQILALCQQHEIQFLTSFMLEVNDTEGDMLATTYLKGSEQNDQLTRAKDAIISGPLDLNIIHDYIGNMERN